MQIVIITYGSITPFDTITSDSLWHINMSYMVIGLYLVTRFDCFKSENVNAKFLYESIAGEKICCNCRLLIIVILVQLIGQSLSLKWLHD